MKKLIFLFLAIFMLVQVFSLNQIFYSSAHAEERSVTIKEKRGASSALSSDMKYHALIIGSNNYKFLPKLQTAIADAKAIEDILKNKYGFKTKLLIDATRDDILNNINEIRKKLTGNDNLLIYYAGHGEYDKNVDKAYWLPVDAERDNPTKWIIAEDITSNIKRISSKHILLVSDSCYSGTLTRAAVVDLKGAEKEEYIKKMIERPSRTLMASGGNEPVADSGGGDHSVFASAFLKALRETEKNAFTAEDLFHGRVKEIVAGKSDQVPEYNTIKNSGHEGGDFVFQLASIANEGSGLKPEPASQPSSEISEEFSKLREEKAKLKREREELAQKKAIMEEKNRLEEERRKLEKEKLEIASLQPAKSLQETIRSSDGRYIDNGDGTITDTKTGLMWAKKDSYADLGKCLDWNYSNGYAGNLRTGGYNNWRLPTVDELKAIYEKSKSNKDFSGNTIYIDPIFASGGAYWYWSSNTPDSNSARGVPFTFGNDFIYGRDYCGTGGVRVVRR